MPDYQVVYKKSLVNSPITSGLVNWTTTPSPIIDYRVTAVRVKLRVQVSSKDKPMMIKGVNVRGVNTAGQSALVASTSVETMVNFTDTYTPIDLVIPINEIASNIDPNSITMVGFVFGYETIYLNPQTQVFLAGDQFLEIDWTPLNTCTPPNTIVAQDVCYDGNPLTVTWSGYQNGEVGSIAGFDVYRKSDIEVDYSKVGFVTVAEYVEQPENYTLGRTYYYRIKTISTAERFDSELSSVNSMGTLIAARPAAPAAQNNGGATYNENPIVLITLGADPYSQRLTVTASGWTPSRDTAPPGSKVTVKKVSAAAAGSNTVTVYNTNQRGDADNYVAFTFTKITPAWTDDPVIAGTTVIKAAHINELRAAMDNLCDYYDIPRTEWAEEVVAGETASINFPLHIVELQDTARRIVDYINAWDTASGRNHVVIPTLQAPIKPTAESVNLLRSAILLM